MSESFVNDASTQAASFHKDGSATSGRSTGAAALTISYDAASQGYTVSTSGRAQTFLPSDVSTSQSSPQVKVYSKTSGSLTESLSLTQPGTSGRLTYQYAGAGFWQRATDTGATLDTTFDAFTYGVATPDGAVPRSGNGLFSVDLIGALSTGVPRALSGDGTFQVDFGAGTFATNGTLREIAVDTGTQVSSTAFAGAGTLSASTNGFTGAFGFNNAGQFTGGIAGRFYGPSAQEVGATWYANQSDGRVASGALIGRSDPNATATNLSLTNLAYSQTFAGPLATLAYTEGSANATTAQQSATLAYDAAAKTYTYADPSITDTPYAASDKAAGESSTKIDVYKHAKPDGSVTRLMLYKPGSGNGELALTYASFGHWQSIGPADSGGKHAVSDRYFVWGEKTDPNLLPRSGTGHFDGLVYGAAMDASATAYDIGGTSAFDLNFGGASFTGQLALTSKNRATGATGTVGSFAFNGGLIGGNATLSAGLSGGTGNFSGQLFGPQATELGGVFTLQTSGAGAINIAGATVAKRAQ